MPGSGPRRFADRRVLVAGAGGAIGQAITQCFLGEGASVVVCDYRADRVDELVGLYSGADRSRLVPVVGDVSDAVIVESVVSTAIKELGGIDVLVNNAGVAGVVPVVEMSEHQWDEVLRVNAKSVFLLSKAVLPGMLRRRRGAIVNVASVAGKRGEPFSAHYCAAKAAVINFARALALEAAPNVRVNTVCPGYIDSAMTRAGAAAYAERVGTDEAVIRRERREGIPLGIQSGEDVAAAICFLASDEAKSLTGVTLDVNGGEVMS